MPNYCTGPHIVPYVTIKRIIGVLIVLLVINIFYAIKLFISAIKIRSHVGYFINLVSNGDGDILPTLQAIPVLIFFLINFGMAVLLYLALDKNEKPVITQLMFYLILATFILIVGVFAIMIGILVHSYHEHQSLHDGITDAMKKYSKNLKVKEEIDKLQIEFQCCGSKKYEEWYSIVWYDAAIAQNGKINEGDGFTPFSCCLFTSMFPCVHHNIENTGKNYLYTPEFNLSISTDGCYHALRKEKKVVGWQIVLNLLCFNFFQILTLILFRLMQTAHSKKNQFMGRTMDYKIWLFNCARKPKQKKEEEKPSAPPRRAKKTKSKK